MEQNQGTKSSIEMFDLDTGANDQGLSDKVVVINNFEIKQESDLTLQATHIASDKSQAPGEQSISTGNRLLEQDETNNIQHLKVNIPSEDLSSAAQAGKFGLLSLDLSKYADDDNKQIILRNLPKALNLLLATFKKMVLSLSILPMPVKFTLLLTRNKQRLIFNLKSILF